MLGLAFALGACDRPARSPMLGGSTVGLGGGLHAVGNQLVDGAGNRVLLHGLDHSGAEYSCVEGAGIFDGPADEAMVDAMAAWRVNVVRLPLNEDCWLSLNGVSDSLSGPTYQKAIEDYVALLHSRNFYVILDLHWTAPGSYQAIDQQPMADLDHAPDFWRSVATAFQDDPAIIFDVFNEPYIDFENARTSDPWDCWQNGCTIVASDQPVTGEWAAAGMQQLVDAVRSTGATQLILAGGLDYANDLTGWLAHRPNDFNIAASFHNYNFTPCNTQECWERTILPLAANAPLITGEIGEDDCGHHYIDRYMAWADSLQLSYLGWTWNAWGGCGDVLIKDWDGTPTDYGAGYQAHLATLP